MLKRMRQLHELEEVVATAFVQFRRNRPREIPRMLLTPFLSFLEVVCQDILASIPRGIGRALYNQAHIQSLEGPKQLRTMISLSDPDLLAIFVSAWGERHPACEIFGPPLATLQRFTQLFDRFCQSRRAMWYLGLAQCWQVAEANVGNIDLRERLNVWIARECAAAQSGQLATVASALQQYVWSQKHNRLMRFWMATEAAAFAFRMFRCGRQAHQLLPLATHTDIIAWTQRQLASLRLCLPATNARVESFTSAHVASLPSWSASLWLTNARCAQTVVATNLWQPFTEKAQSLIKKSGTKQSGKKSTTASAVRSIRTLKSFWPEHQP